MKQTILFSLLTLLLIQSPPQQATAQTLEEKIGQMMMVALPTLGVAKDTLLVDIETRNLGGVLFFQNTLQNPTQIRNLMEELQDHASINLFLATDQEGGRVARLNQNNGYQETLHAHYLGTTIASVSATRNQAAMMAGWLAEAGLNVNLAPVVDVNVNSDSPAIGRLNRSYSSDPGVVATHALAFMEEHAKLDIITSTKHFPGHGSALADSHFGFTDITNTWQDYELMPYELIFDDTMPDMVMTGHLYHADIDPDHPVSISELGVNGLLRDSLGYDGVVISDELFMQAISNNYSLDEALIRTVNSGTDILLFNTNMCSTRCNSSENISLTRYAVNRIVEAVNNGQISETRINESYDRIIALKNRRIPTSIGPDAGVDSERPIAITLDQNFPNPFNPSTTIRWHMPEDSHVRLAVYDLLGRQVAVLADEHLPRGTHHRVFNATPSLASGIYLYRLEAGGVVQSNRMTLVK